MKRTVFALAFMVIACCTAAAQNQPQAQATATCGGKTLTPGVFYPIFQDLTGTLCTAGGGGGGGGAVTIANGADTAEGTTTDSPAAVPTSGTAATTIALLKALTNIAALPITAQSNHTTNIGAIDIGQSAPGTTNGVAIVGVNSATALAGAGAVGTGSQRVAVGQDTTTVAGSAPGPAADTASVPAVLSPTSSATSAVSGASTTALGTSLVAKASAGNLYGFNCTGVTGGAAGYCIVYNSTTAPSTGPLTGANVLDFCYFDTTARGCSLGRHPMAKNYSTGIVVLVSSAASPYTYTTGTDTAAISVDYK